MVMYYVSSSQKEPTVMYSTAFKIIKTFKIIVNITIKLLLEEKHFVLEKTNNNSLDFHNLFTIYWCIVKELQVFLHKIKLC